MTERIHRSRSGFTLIEVLVTVVVIGVLAAVVIPAVTSQMGAGDTARVIDDLNNIRTGIENFDLAVRVFPGDMDDLANPITTADATGSPRINFTSAQVAAWAGPYIEQAVSSTTSGPSFDASPTGLGAAIDNNFQPCNISAANTCSFSGQNYLTIQLNHLTAAQDTLLNDLIDGPGESNPGDSGKFRFYTPYLSANPAYYYATPYRQ